VCVHVCGYEGEGERRRRGRIHDAADAVAVSAVSVSVAVPLVDDGFDAFVGQRSVEAVHDGPLHLWEGGTLLLDHHRRQVGVEDLGVSIVIHVWTEGCVAAADDVDLLLSVKYLINKHLKRAKKRGFSTCLRENGCWGSEIFKREFYLDITPRKQPIERLRLKLITVVPVLSLTILWHVPLIQVLLQ
jgi:hypothetical protein